MTSLEEKALQSSPITPICYYRKVDETFVMLKVEDDPNCLLQHLNNQHPRIKFTMEKENCGIIPFLDVLVNRNGSTIQTSIYRKPTHTDQYIHYQSNHPIKVKAATISTLAHRAKEICNPELPGMPEERQAPKDQGCGRTSHSNKRICLTCTS
ncbi:hypothetical protein SNE40_013173 [Patella caerulea]|uniref:Helix-turn-helix domain-containing protein n=1 Tax=Patella caerulea TaxID=87958 RepID=A0AAN8PNI7_PATCE